MHIALVAPITGQGIRETGLGTYAAWTMSNACGLPRRMLSAWVPSRRHARRPVGAPVMTYGRSITKALAKFHIDKARWHELTADRQAWRETLRTGNLLTGLLTAYQSPPSPPPVKPISLTRQQRRSSGAASQPPTPPSTCVDPTKAAATRRPHQPPLIGESELPASPLSPVPLQPHG